jgi:multiple sugar transport system permease protein
MRTGKLKTNSNCLAWLFLGPSLLGFSLFYLLPFVTGFYYSLVDSPINRTLVGLYNYTALLKNPSFLLALYNTAKFTVICVPLNIFFSLAAALLLNRKIRGRNLFRTVFITPLVIPVGFAIWS